MVAEPGSRIGYNTALSSVLSVIVSKVTGMSAAEYADTWLFAPLGIEDWQWSEFRPGISVGGAGLYLRPGDMARFGQLYLQRGQWNDRQVVPSAWVDASTSAHGSVDQMHAYGYHWWTYSEHAAADLLNGHRDIYFALGRGGQHIWVLPWADAVVVCTAWNDGNGYWPEPMLWEYVGPAIRR